VPKLPSGREDPAEGRLKVPAVKPPSAGDNTQIIQARMAVPIQTTEIKGAAIIIPGTGEAITIITPMNILPDKILHPSPITSSMSNLIISIRVNIIMFFIIILLIRTIGQKPIMYGTIRLHGLTHLTP
jgi:hypothetical protein